jgi:hypothetical protein
MMAISMRGKPNDRTPRHRVRASQRHRGRSSSAAHRLQGTEERRHKCRRPPLPKRTCTRCSRTSTRGWKNTRKWASTSRRFDANSAALKGAQDSPHSHELNPANAFTRYHALTSRLTPLCLHQIQTVSRAVQVHWRDKVRAIFSEYRLQTVLATRFASTMTCNRGTNG